VSHSAARRREALIDLVPTAYDASSARWFRANHLGYTTAFISRVRPRVALPARTRSAWYSASRERASPWTRYAGDAAALVRREALHRPNI
jgi:hypothetical protein